MKNIPYFKIGDTLLIPIQWVDSETDLGIPIASDTLISCTMLTSYGVEYFPDVIINPDQNGSAGSFTISLPSTITETLKPCTITTDIKIVVNGQVKHSDDFTFSVKRSITE